MPKYRKKPIVIEAELCTESMVIVTREGNMVAELEPPGTGGKHEPRA